MAAPKKKEVKLSITCRVSQKAIDNCEAIAKDISVSFSKVVSAAMEKYTGGEIIVLPVPEKLKVTKKYEPARTTKVSSFLESRRKSKQGLK